MTSEKQKNIFMPKSISSITIVITLEQIDKIKIEKSNKKRT